MKKFNILKPQIQYYASSSAPTLTTHIGLIDWFMPRAKNNEDPAKYVGRVAKFLREWNGYTLKEIAEKSGNSYGWLSRAENGKWSSIKKMHKYLLGYGVQMKLEFKPNQGGEE